MDPVGDLVRYITGIDWLLGVAIAACAVAATVGIAYAIQHGSWTPPDRLSAMGRRAMRRIRRLRGPVAETRWLCEACRSWNGPEAATCYLGCGPRQARELPLPEAGGDDEGGDGAARPAPQLGGRHTRRG